MTRVILNKSQLFGHMVPEGLREQLRKEKWGWSTTVFTHFRVMYTCTVVKWYAAQKGKKSPSLPTSPATVF